MSAYLSYETERREIIIVPVNILELNINGSNTSRWYPESFRISFLNDTDAYEFIKFFEIEQEEISWKYIKSDLFLYNKEMRFGFKGCFPTEFNIDIPEVELHYDYFNSHTLNEQDKLVLLSQNRNLKLEALGI